MTTVWFVGLDNAAPDVPSEELIEAVPSVRRGPIRGTSIPARSMVALGSDGVFRWPSLQLAAAQAAHGAGDLRLSLRVGVPGLRRRVGIVPCPRTPVRLRRGRCPGRAAVHGSRRRGGAVVDPDAAGLAGVSPVRETRPGRAGLAAVGSRRCAPTMIFGHRTGTVDGPRNEELSVWERYRPLLRPRRRPEPSGPLAEDVPTDDPPGRHEEDSGQPRGKDPSDDPPRADEWPGGEGENPQPPGRDGRQHPPHDQSRARPRGSSSLRPGTRSGHREDAYDQPQGKERFRGRRGNGSRARRECSAWETRTTGPRS